MMKKTTTITAPWDIFYEHIHLISGKQSLVVALKHEYPHDVPFTIEILNDHIKVSSGFRWLKLFDNGIVTLSVRGLEHEYCLNKTRKAVNGDITILQRTSWREFIKENTNHWHMISQHAMGRKNKGPIKPLVSKSLQSRRCEPVGKKIIVGKEWLLVYSGSSVSFVDIEWKEITIRAGFYPVIFEHLDIEETITIYPKESAIKAQAPNFHSIEIEPHSEAATIVSKKVEKMPLENSSFEIGQRTIIVLRKTKLLNHLENTKILAEDNHDLAKNSTLSSKLEPQDASKAVGGGSLNDLFLRLERELYDEGIFSTLNTSERIPIRIHKLLLDDITRLREIFIKIEDDPWKNNLVDSLKSKLISSGCANTEMLYNCKVMIDRLFVMMIAVLAFEDKVKLAKDSEKKIYKVSGPPNVALAKFVKNCERCVKRMLEHLEEFLKKFEINVK